LIHRLNKTCSPPWLLEAGLRPETVSRVAVCGGSCSEFAETARQKDADVFITAEVKHSIARWAEDAGFWIIDGGHFATENLVIPVLQQRLEKELQAEGLKIKIHIAPQDPPLRMI
ncbi:MAG: Nif3-like dinuclear metal center hexameric protein, partial [Desulfobulbaceae bacterium]|nr:Nif3-like dinuclear metal center hexameric protein [Desulfobulbaceae bacterium]